MEAPLHQSPVPPPPLQDAAISAALLQQAEAAARAMMMVAQKKQQPAAAAQLGREQCPRCASRDTKFCYYNNYNTAQPRHFCRACRRYWTLGGSLRNVPVGGSTRKRPRPARPTRAIAAAVAASSAAAAANATTTTSSSPCFASSTMAAPVPLAPPSPGGLLGSLLLGLGSASPLLALGSAPLLEGRLGSDDLGLGQPPALLNTGAGDLAQLGFGAGPFLWPAATTTVLEGEHRAETAAWKSGSACPLQLPLPPPGALWQELAAAAPPVEAGGLLRHGGSPHLLL
ncbi:hypothetical protein BAE44_0013087 [Dichanthelium oligosanthes]|uniref:Dof zinc finger protein n=1 Tax=Dichanthelium oligosanthes TaxID=888268 RepID=A0A1E5VL72_9POAL|nr:hypothetical protein BAE44_0013087 [Dichanthelium oligosanthes]